MRIEFTVQNDLCILRLKGRFVTGSDVDYLRTRDALQNQGLRKVVADCREVPYIDSTGLTFVVGLYAAMKKSTGNFVLANANRRVRDVLGIAGLDGVIPIFENEQAAIAALKVAA
jgi:anti-anti-sigma factor